MWCFSVGLAAACGFNNICFNYHLQPHVPPVSAPPAIQAGPGGPSSPEAIVLWNVGLNYISVVLFINKDMEDRCGGENLLRWRSQLATNWPFLEKPTSHQLTFLFGGRHSKRDNFLVLPKPIEVPNFSPSLSFRFNFSVQIPGFSMANSGQLVAGSAPWSTLLAGLECHSATKKILQPKCSTNIAELFNAPKQVFPVYPEHRCRAKDTEKPQFGSLPGPAPKPFYSLSVGLISDDFLAVEKAKLCGTFVSEPGSLFCDWWQFFLRSGSQQIACGMVGCAVLTSSCCLSWAFVFFQPFRSCHFPVNAFEVYHCF